MNLAEHFFFISEIEQHCFHLIYLIEDCC